MTNKERGLNELGFIDQGEVNNPPDEKDRKFVKQTTHTIAGNPIMAIIGMSGDAEDFMWKHLYIGVEATVDWRSTRSIMPALGLYSSQFMQDFLGAPIRGIPEGDCYVDLVKMARLLEDINFFEDPAKKMVEEHKNGREFISVLIPEVLKKFPSFPVVADNYDDIKSVEFVDENLERALTWRIHNCEFQVSFGDIIDASGAEYGRFKLDDRSVLITNSSAIWFPSKHRITDHNPGNLQDRVSLLNQSLDAIDQWFSKHPNAY